MLFFSNFSADPLDVDYVNRCCDRFRHHVQLLNNSKFIEIQNHLDAATNNLIANTRWRFVDAYGEKLEKVTEKQPIMWK